MATTAETPGDDLGEVAFSPDGESWIEHGPPDARRRVAFHDYAAIYATPGLYERVFQDALGMRSTAEVVRLYGEALAAAGVDPAGERVVDLGAGNGIGGAALRALGVGHVVGVDLEPEAATAAARDRPGVYDEYLVGDVGAWSDAELARLAGHRPTAVLLLSAVGYGHVPPATLDRALSLLAPGGRFGFAVKPELLPGATAPEAIATGFPAYLAGLRERAEDLVEHAYVHRRRADGSDDPAVALVGRVG